MCGFSANKPVIMVMGGSQGAANVNKAVRQALPQLLEVFVDHNGKALGLKGLGVKQLVAPAAGGRQRSAVP